MYIKKRGNGKKGKEETLLLKFLTTVKIRHHGIKTLKARRIIKTEPIGAHATI
jgi:hypothetical protein